jgi:membrane protein involved in D-alanine export
MVPFADFQYFGLLFYLLLPFAVLGLFGRLGRNWSLLAMGLLLVLQAADNLIPLRPELPVRELYLVLGYTMFQGCVAWALLRWRSRAFFYAAVALSILPLTASKFLPTLWPQTVFGFAGISYVTFRSLDVLLSIQDGLLKQLSIREYAAFLLFVPALSSGPIDRYRRFVKDWEKTRSRDEFLEDLDCAVRRVAQGFLYKFIIAALIKSYWLDPWATGRRLMDLWMYMYAYTLYLFFDFAGYSAFAVGVGRFFGIRLPENFDRPFLSKNIRDFWNRWHISLSFWFRDHVYMRFLLAASKGKWFKGKHTASVLGLFLTFGIMGVWHGLGLHYILYGLYHAALLAGYDWFSRWNKERKLWVDGVWQIWLDRLLTFHSIAFGLLLFSGRLTPPPPPQVERLVEKVDCNEVTGVAWDRATQKVPVTVDLLVDDAYIDRRAADEFREDLKERGFGNGKHGFRFPLPWWVRDGRPHIVEVRDIVSGLPFKGSPYTLECERNEEELQREEEKLRRAREAGPALQSPPQQASPVPPAPEPQPLQPQPAQRPQ